MRRILARGEADRASSGTVRHPDRRGVDDVRGSRSAPTARRRRRPPDRRRRWRAGRSRCPGRRRPARRRRGARPRRRRRGRVQEQLDDRVSLTRSVRPSLASSSGHRARGRSARDVARRPRVAVDAAQSRRCATGGRARPPRPASRRRPGAARRCGRVVIRVSASVAEQVARGSRRRGRARTAWPSVTTAVRVVAMPARVGSRRTPSAQLLLGQPDRGPRASRPDRRRVGEGGGGDDVRRGRRRDLAGGRSADAVGDEHARGTDEPRVLVAGAHEAHVAHGDPENRSNPVTPSVVAVKTISRAADGSPVGWPRRAAAEAAIDPHTMGAMEWLLLAISVGLVLACGVFGAAEYSLRGGRPRPPSRRRRRGRQAGDRGAAGAAHAVHAALRRPDRRHADQPGDRLPGRARDREPARGPADGARAARGRRAGRLGHPRPGAGHHRHDDLRRARPQEAGHRRPVPDRPPHPGPAPRLHQGDDLPDQAAERLGQRDRAGARASSRRRSSGRRAPPTSWPRSPAAPRARAPWTPRRPTWCSARWPSDPAPPARS